MLLQLCAANNCLPTASACLHRGLSKVVLSPTSGTSAGAGEYLVDDVLEPAIAGRTCPVAVDPPTWFSLFARRGERLGELGTVCCWFAARCSPNSRLNVRGELHHDKNGEDERRGAIILLRENR